MTWLDIISAGWLGWWTAKLTWGWLKKRLGAWNWRSLLLRGSISVTALWLMGRQVFAFLGSLD